MSVHGEFDRYLDATLRALRGSQRTEHVSIANEIEPHVSDPTVPLDERARRILDGPLASAPDLDGIPGLADAKEGLLAVSRIILGR